MPEYFLPDVNKLRALPCKYDMKLLQHDDFEKLYTPQWSNALQLCMVEYKICGDRGKKRFYPCMGRTDHQARKHCRQIKYIERTDKNAPFGQRSDRVS